MCLFKQKAKTVMNLYTNSIQSLKQQQQNIRPIVRVAHYLISWQEWKRGSDG